MSKEIKWDRSESYIVNYHDGKQDAYYVCQIAFYNGKQDFKMETDVHGYYLLVCNVPNFNIETNELGKADADYSDLRLLVPCSRRSEKSFNLALEMMDKESRESIEIMEEDKKFLEDLAKENDIDVEEMKKRMKELKDAIDKVGNEVEDEKAKKVEKVKKENKNKKKITFADVAGMEEVKNTFKDVIDQLKRPELYKHFDIEPIKSLLMYGASGTGKTFIANAFANEIDANFIKISMGDIASKYQGQTGNNIKRIFDEARKSDKFTVLFWDEVDAVANRRGMDENSKEKNSTMNVLLTEMSSDDNDNIFMIFATNYIELIDDAFLRSGRCDIKIKVPLPDVETRLQILELNTRKKPLGVDVKLRTIAEMMEGNNCADVSLLVNQSARVALKKDKMEINQEDFIETLEKLNMRKKEEKEKKIGFSL